MNLIPANQMDMKKVEQFLEKNEGINKASLVRAGYVVEVSGEIVGCFSLETMEEGIYWLKQLYINQTNASKLPVLLEAILTLAKQQQAKSVYVHSHQPVVDILLEALQFHPQKEKMFVDKYKRDEGNWWLYHVS
ncbi:GNAT family N-acetyltransferase [Oceanobacillus picturae]|uniref:GNAT family N-acetyltransferase n=1 Tax=Oceanobacillus picturae TaxID=171693 RepID=UPI003628F5D6